MSDTCFIQGLGIILVAQSILFFFVKAGEVKRKSDSWQQVPSTSAKYPQTCTRLLLYPDLDREQHCRGIYQFLQACSLLLLIPSQHFMWTNFRLHESSSFGQFSVCKTCWHSHKKGTWEGLWKLCQLSQEGHRKSYLTFITHLARTCSHSRCGNKDGSPLEKIPHSWSITSGQHRAMGSCHLSFTLTDTLI